MFRVEWLTRIPGKSHRIVRACGLLLLAAVMTWSGVACDGVIRPISASMVARSARRMVSLVLAVWVELTATQRLHRDHPSAVFVSAFKVGHWSTYTWSSSVIFEDPRSSCRQFSEPWCTHVGNQRG